MEVVTNGEKIRVCGQISARKVVMMKTWKEVNEKESKGESADYGEIVRKHWAEIKPKPEKNSVLR